MAGNTLYLSGQIGVDPVTLQLVPGGLVPETEQVSINVEELFPYTKIKVFRTNRQKKMYLQICDLLEVLFNKQGKLNCIDFI